MRALYEGYAEALASYLRMPLPPWIADQPHKDNWLTVAKVRAQTETANPHSSHGTRVEDVSPAIATLREDHHDF
jgi:hypothetical protein